MSKIGIDEVQRIAGLARIALTAEEAALMAVELGQIVGFVEHLRSVDTSGVETTSQITGLEDVWREDELRATNLSREQLLANAPAVQDGYIKVRRVLG